MNTDKSLQLLTNLLVEKFGVDVMTQLLLDKVSITPCEALKKANYTRQLREVIDPFNPYQNAEPEKPYLILRAMGEAAENMNYSNWICDKIYIAQEIVIRYCKEHNIPIEIN